jgi:tetratricopeptide (TPR) repeat protein
MKTSNTLRWSLSLLWILLSVALVSGCSKKKKSTTATKDPAAGKKEADRKGGDTGTDTTPDGAKDGGTGPDTTPDGAKDGDTSPDSTPADGKTADDPKPADTRTDGPATPPKEQTEAEKLRAQVLQAEQLVAKRTDAAYKEALGLVTEILKRDFSNFDALLVMATIHYQQENLEKMRSVLDYIQGLHKKNNPPTEPGPQWQYMMGKYYLFLAEGAEGKGMNISAISYRSQAEKYFGHPSAGSHPEALFALGVLLLERQETAPGVAALEKAERLGGGNVLKKEWRLPLNLGAGYLMQKKADAALTKLEYALNLNKGCERCHYNLALLYISVEDFPKVGSITDKERADKALYHARTFNDALKKRKNADRALQIRVESWMELARERQAAKGAK